MARKYARDNRGRFASKGTGATARGGRLKTAGGNKRETQTIQAAGGRAGTIGKPRGLKPGTVTARMAATKPAAAASKPAAKGRKPAIDDAKVSRVVGRVNAVVQGSDAKSGVKRMNSLQVGVRAKEFLARKAGGVASINAMGQQESFAAVRKAMTKPPRYSTQQPNRNKPGRFNDLGQDKARAKARSDAMNARQRISQSTTPSSAQSSAVPTRARRGIGPRALALPPPSVPGYASASRIPGTISAKGRSTRSAVPAASGTVARTRRQAGAAQRFRANAILDRTRPVIGRNAGLRRRDTGMSQLSLTGPSRTLYSYKPTKLRSRR